MSFAVPDQILWFLNVSNWFGVCQNNFFKDRTAQSTRACRLQEYEAQFSLSGLRRVFLRQRSRKMKVQLGRSKTDWGLLPSPTFRFQFFSPEGCCLESIVGTVFYLQDR